MPNERVSQLNALLANDVQTNDIVFVTDTSQKESKKLEMGQLLLFLESSGSFNGAHATQADTASYILGSNVSGLVISASFAIKAGLSNTASFATQALTASNATTASFSLSNATFATVTSASWASSSLSSSLSQATRFLIFSANNGTASYAMNAAVAATTTTVLSASYAFTSSVSISSSFATTASVLVGGASAGINPAGAVILYAGNSSPTGYLECDGSSVSQSTWPSLFTAIGTVFGGGSDSGATTFSLPDMRGMFARGWDHGAGIDSGRAFGSQQSDALQDHTHFMTPDWVKYSGGSQALGGGGSQGDGGNQTGLVASGYRKATETRPINIALMYCIKT